MEWLGESLAREHCKVQQLEERAIQQEQERQCLEGQLAQKHQELEENDHCHQQEKQEQLQRERALQTQIEELRELAAQTNRYRDHAEQLEGQVQHLQGQADNYRDETGQLQTQVKHLQDETEQYRDRLGHLQGQVQQLEGQVVELDQYRRQVGQLQAEIQRLQQTTERQVSEVEFWKVPRQEIQISEKIGSGGWASVARGTFRGQEIAVKRPHKLIVNARNINRLKREVRIMARIRHPNLLLFIAAVFDEQVDQLQALPLIVMELLDMDLRAAYENDQLADNSMVSIFHDVACALHYLHEHHEPIIHRDVSAANVLLQALANNNWRAKLSDFGSANWAEEARTAGEGAIIYTAPEAFAPESDDPNVEVPPLTPKMDVYSYGVLLCEVITKRLPIREEFPNMLQQIQREWPFMYNLIVSCRKRNPEERTTMAAVLIELNKTTH